MSTPRSRMVIPPVRCSATANRTGEQCRAWAMAGATVCGQHGGQAPQVRAKAAARMTAAAVQDSTSRSLVGLLDAEPRMPWTVLLDGVHVTDALARDMLAQVREAGPDAQPELIDRMLRTYRASHEMSESVIRLGLVKLVARLQEYEVAATRGLLLGVVDTLVAHLGATERSELRLWVVRAAQAGLAALEERPRRVDEAPTRARARGEDAEGEWLTDAVRDAAGGVPWDLDLVLVSRDELEALRAAAAGRSAIAAGPHGFHIRDVVVAEGTG